MVVRGLAALGVVCAIAGVGSLALPARATPGPESVVVVANGNVAESVALARTYVDARAVPERQLCLLDVPDQPDIDLATFDDSVYAALHDCLETNGLVDRVDTLLLVRGMPLRLEIPGAGGEGRVSLAAALAAWESTTMGDGERVVGQAPGQVDCAGACYAAAWPNPLYRRGRFTPGWTLTFLGVSWRPLLVTMLHGRSYADAEKLLTSALDAEESGGADGEFLLMDGADPARGIHDRDYPDVAASLADRGYTDVSHVAFNSDLTGQTLAAFFTGTEALGPTIEGNTFLPGSIVDNVTSLGAVAENFEAAGEVQVSIARWVVLGVAGVHGTTDEPLAGAFPDRQLLVDYVDGTTLAESFFRYLPYGYWQNLVLGDPLCAPYATRPVVMFEGIEDGDTVAGVARFTVAAMDAEGRGIDNVVVFLDGEEIARSEGGTLGVCVELSSGSDVQLLAVAQAADDATDRGYAMPKGWTSIRIDGAAGDSRCPTELPDAGGESPDGGSDAGSGASGGAKGCGCSAVGAARASGAWPVLGLLALVSIRSNRRSTRRPDRVGLESV